MSEIKELKTKDLGEAASFICNGKKLVGLEDSGNGFHFFIFHDEDGTLETISRYFWDGSLMVHARDFSNAVRMLKNRLHSRSGK